MEKASSRPEGATRKVAARSGEEPCGEASWRSCGLQSRDIAAHGDPTGELGNNSTPFLPSPATTSHWSNPIRRQRASEPFDAVYSAYVTEQSGGGWRPGRASSALFLSFWVVPLEGKKVPSSSPFPVSTHKKESVMMAGAKAAPLEHKVEVTCWGCQATKTTRVWIPDNVGHDGQPNTNL